MKRSWLLALGVAALMSAICVYWWSVGRNKWQPPPPLKPDLPELIALPVPSQVKATQAKERPLFWAARRPAASASAQADAKTGVESELAQSRLMAVLESGARRVALLQRPDGGVLKISSVGPAGPWHLDSFNGKVAVFVSRDGQRVERPLAAVRGPAVPAPGAASTLAPRASAPAGAPPAPPFKEPVTSAPGGPRVPFPPTTSASDGARSKMD